MRIRTTKRRGKDRSFRNENRKLTPSAVEAVIGAIASIDGGTNFATAYLEREFLAKYCDETLTPAATRRLNAIGKFRDCEEQNAATNLWLRSVDPEYNILPRVTWRKFLSFSRHLIRDILGPLRDGVVLGSFSGGASTSRRRTESHPAQKFTGKADLTEGVWQYIDLIYRCAPMLQQHYSSFTSFNEVEGSVLFTVPKKTDIDRCACKEPDINMYLQKGVGNHIRRRLRRYNIDLNDQSRNRQLAQIGSLDRDDGYATLDLSSASDLISFECVKTLLPADWFGYLDDIRSKSVSIDGEYHRLEMFSSMGNGFTFELESLIFFALMRAVSYFEGSPGVVSVYGDDIIIPKRNSELASFVLSRFGFSVNMDKSYSSGPFRESCGGHYHEGDDVSPFYLKRLPTRLTDVIRVANQLRRWAFADKSRQYEVQNLYYVWCKLASHVPKVLWGGYDYNRDTQLVSPPVPNASTLVRVNDDQELPDDGLYLAWHNSNWDRTRPAEPSEKPISTNQKCRIRRTKPGAPVCEEYFLQEIFPHR